MHRVILDSDGKGSPPNKRTLNEDFEERTTSCSSLSDHRLKTDGVICKTETPWDPSQGNKISRRLGADAFIDLVVTSNDAPAANATKTSTTLGSNVDGEERKTRSVDVTLHLSLRSRYKINLKNYKIE